MRLFDASSAHRGLWLAQKMVPATLNHPMFMWDVDGQLDAAVMADTFRYVLDEAEVLRVTFADGGDGLRLAVREMGDWQPFFLDVSGATDPEQAARDELGTLVGTPFDLERELLLRMGVVTLAANRCLVVVIYHHLVSDGQGAGGLLSRRLAEVYTALAQGSHVPPLPHPWDAEPFMAEAARYRDSPEFAADAEFWRTYLADAPAPAQVPRIAVSDSSRSALCEPIGAADRWSQLAESIGMVSRTLTVAHAEAQQWVESAKSMGVWMSSFVAAAAAVYFRHRCDRPDFLFSLVVANRVGVASRTPGLAVNVVPVRMRVPLGATFSEIADAVVDETYQIFGHTACHYSDIVEVSESNLSDRSSFGAAINIIEGVEQLDFAGLRAHHIGATTGAFNDLQIGVYTDGRAGSDLFIRFEAPPDLYSAAELRVIGTELITFIRALVAAGPRLPVGALDVLSGAERERVLKAPNDTGVPQSDSTLAELFAQQVEQAPDAVAVVSGDSTVSYGTLDERSSRLAEALRRRGVGPETVVAVAMPRSADLVVALLAVGKAGGAYLPIDPALPAERIASVVRDGSVRLWLTDAATAKAHTPEPDVPLVLFDEILSDAADEDGGAGELAAPLRPDLLAAVMYGNSSDLTAAGVAVTHQNLCRLVMDRQWRDGGSGVVLWHSPHTYDVLPLEVWVPLLNGGRVVVAPQGELDVDTLNESRAAHPISAVWLPPGLFSTIASEHPEAVAGLREVWTGGERVSAAAVRRMRLACPELTIVVGHGPTETTVFAAGDRLTADGPAHYTEALGRPVDHAALYVLGPGLAPVPALGGVGELYVAGPGVTRGYHGRPGRTAQRFVPCPFGPAGALMYRTGDRVRWGADGVIEYVGGVGTEMRVRDVWIAPAEAEEVLSQHPGLAQSVVVIREDDSGQQRLVAYVVPVGGRVVGGDGARDHRAGLSDGELRRFTAGRLPEFAVPSAFVVLERLPVTPGGRVDRAALPKPEFGDGPYRAPRDDTERVLAEAFAEVLELERVGIDDDFFDLGGNSLRAIRLVGLIRSQLNLEVSIRTLFAARTISGLSDMWDDLARSSRPALRRRTKGGHVL
ncbi:AMP-binding protein [Streptomyces sp. PSAA01]|uniref:non-ribosomal peptide synthetase n=1 Tax=Streptomyces sp. PSAA01 TaxID=2912762 RepID=UPI001F2C3807|nr:AMP-binding protein [Streptomyces sp. PSAA01]MCG0283775.1 AMP-binding protein [Streptomyces sp. PSAA01]